MCSLDLLVYTNKADYICFVPFYSSFYLVHTDDHLMVQMKILLFPL